MYPSNLEEKIYRLQYFFVGSGPRAQPKTIVWENDLGIHSGDMLAGWLAEGDNSTAPSTILPSYPPSSPYNLWGQVEATILGGRPTLSTTTSTTTTITATSTTTTTTTTTSPP
ncbi:hypothetical protein Pmani_040038 [Petrolisthes manimaculis]|uniref:Uncharacterized protein n=1 Tax=Petrolisthes manimaculis TaxID=1843537 RepID=A0AAE1NBC6_9EUCA|nr:hypothetical protein Pmani_040038 [Petrolisthes manimaculis]